MIAMIKVVSNRIVKRDTINGLGLIYSDIDRLGKKSGDLKAMSTSEYYFDELEKVEVKNDDGNKTEYKYYALDEDGERKSEVSSWYRYHRVDKPESYVLLSQEEQLVDLVEFAPKAIGIEYKIIRTIVPKEPDIQNMQIMLDKVQTKINHFQAQVDAFSNKTFNQRVDVHMAGGMLGMYNDLLLKEDCCTDELQCHINDGWRMIAVCVQPDQRRPDYILGRYNPELDVSIKTSADR